MTTPTVSQTTTPANGAADAAGRTFAQAVAIMARLRDPGGCPWDREQSFDSIRKYTLEETYEVLDAIERRNWQDLKEELGDLLLQVLFYAQMAAEPGYFTIAEVIAGLNRKLIRRHPHVFGETASIAAGNAVASGMEVDGVDARQVLRNWEQIKQAEKSANGADSKSILDAVPRSFPALMEAAKIGSKAAKVGFDWSNVDAVLEKLEEEISELREAIDQQSSRDEPQSEPQERARDTDHVTSELGDLLFTVVNLARHLRVDPELALRATNRKFRNRFLTMESSAQLPLEQLTPDELERLWAAAKSAEAKGDQGKSSAGATR
jgi:MazG family protein